MEYTNLCNKGFTITPPKYDPTKAGFSVHCSHAPLLRGSGAEYEIPFPQVGNGTYLERTRSETLHCWGLSTSLANKSLECEQQLRTGFNLIHDQPSSKLTWQWKITMFLWVFPKIMVPPNHKFLIRFSIINHPFWGTTIFGRKHPYRGDTSSN